GIVRISTGSRLLSSDWLVTAGALQGFYVCTCFACVLRQIEAQSPGCLRSTGPARCGLKDGERGALGITYDGDPPDILKIGRRHVKFCAELFGFGRSGVTIGNKEVGEPMSQNAGRLMFTVRNAPDELLAIFDVPAIVSGVFI